MTEIFGSDEFQEMRVNLRHVLRELFAKDLPPRSSIKRKDMAREIADEVYGCFSEINFAGDIILALPFAGGSVDKLCFSAYRLSMKLNKPVQFFGNGMEFFIQPKERDNPQHESGDVRYWGLKTKEDVIHPSGGKKWAAWFGSHRVAGPVGWGLSEREAVDALFQETKFSGELFS